MTLAPDILRQLKFEGDFKKTSPVARISAHDTDSYVLKVSESVTASVKLARQTGVSTIKLCRIILLTKIGTPSNKTFFLVIYS